MTRVCTRLRSYFLRLIPFAVLIVAWTVSSPPRAADAPPTETFATVVAPFVTRYCVNCHGSAKQNGSLALHNRQQSSLVKDRDIWDSVIQRLQMNEMPPKKSTGQPTLEEKNTVVAWLNAELVKANCSGTPDPGRVTLRRLNRVEYANTIRDLVSVDYAVNDDFPADDVGYGFDNIGDVLSLSPLLFEKYLAAAERIVEKAFVFQLPPVPPTRRWVGREFRTSLKDEFAKDRARVLPAAGEASVTFNFPKDAEYIIRYQVYGQQVGADPVKMAIRLDEQEFDKVEVRSTEFRPGGLREMRKKVTAGNHTLTLAFLNPYQKPDETDAKKRDRALVIMAAEVQGPLPAVERIPSASYRKIMITQVDDRVSEAVAARRILESFVRKAFRRPVTPDEVNRYVKLFDEAKANGDGFEGGIKLALQAVLVSPHFIFKVERDRKLLDKPYPLSEHELATRLSYFLWSTMPDEELSRLADRGSLRKELDSQVRRMLKDSRIGALADNFAGQWLQIRNLKAVSPDPKQFPTFDDELRDAMIHETILFFEAMVKEDRNLLDFLDADFTFVNGRLAKHYGIPGVKGEEFQRVSLQGTQRAGILTHASILTVTSNPTRTSPVKRGKFILESLMNAPPPPPPPDVPDLKEEKGAELTGSLRQRMEQHRSNPDCATCHQKMDPLGFAFENFDAIGGWRDKDGSFAIDPSGVLPDGRSFKDPADLRRILRGNHEAFRRCVTEKLLTYALGRGVESIDRCFVDQICQTVATRQDRFSELVLAIVLSEPFQMRTPSTRGASK